VNPTLHYMQLVNLICWDSRDVFAVLWTFLNARPYLYGPCLYDFYGFKAPRLNVERPNVERPNVERPNVEQPNVKRPIVERPNVERPNVE
jgi:hypothetical protein